MTFSAMGIPDMHELLLVIHVLGWVFWLGTDIGVFLAAKRSERQDLSVEARLAVLELGMVLDRGPRFAVPVVWTTGMLMLAAYGLQPLPTAVVLGLGALWFVIVWVGIFQPPGTPLQINAMRLQTLIYGAVIVGMGAGALLGLANGSLPGWVAAKWFAYVLVAVAAIWLERAFAPAVADYQRLAESGSQPDVEADLSAHLAPVYWAVLLIYAGTLIGGVSGLVKF